MQNLISSKSSTLLAACIRQPSCCAQIQSVRWASKPRWLPQAKSKRFRIPVRIRPPKDDAEERQYLDRSYDTITRSIWAHEKAKFLRQREIEESQETHLQHEAEIDRIIEENEKLNAIVSANREKIRAEQWKKLEEEIILTRLQKEEEEEERLKLTEQEILQQMARLQAAIKLEDLDDAIEKALGTEVDYNFAIDRNGNAYYGRHNNSMPQKHPDFSLTDEDRKDSKGLRAPELTISVPDAPHTNKLIPHYDYPARDRKPLRPKLFEIYEANE